MQELSNEELHLAEIAGIEIRYYCMKIEKTINHREGDMNAVYTLALTSGVCSETKICNITSMNLLSAIYEINVADSIKSANCLYLSYVPIPLLYERLLLYKAVKSKASIAFSDWNTGEIAEDIKLLKPTSIIGVPTLIEKIYDTIKVQISKLSGSKLSIFNKAYSSKLENYKKTGEVTHKFWDKFVFKKIKNAMGGRLRLIFTGSSLNCPEAIGYLKIVLSCQIIESYGSMETTIACMSTLPGDNISNHLGGPLPGTEAKLKKLKELCIEGYENKEIGELCIRGNRIFQGYYSGEDSLIDNEGWLHTNDILTFKPENCSFDFIDRKFCLINLNCGKTISLQKLENLYKTSVFISQIFIVVKNNIIIGIIVPDEIHAMRIINQENMSFAEFCNTDRLKEEIFKDLEKIHTHYKLKPYETINKIYLESESWISEVVLSPTLKLRRLYMEEQYSDIITRLSSLE